MALTFSSHVLVSPDAQKVAAARIAVQEALDRHELGFAQLPYQDEQVIAEIEHLAYQIAERFDTLIVVGIGGSDLGTRAVHRALNHQFYNLRQQPRLLFVGDTTDPIALQEVLDIVELRQSAVVMVSKSGNTVEQMSTFLILRDLLKKEVGDAFHEHIIAITDPESGTLRELVNKEGYASLAIPSNVGGRFSVFTAVGLFPLAVVGVDIRALLAGSKEVLENQKEAALQYAALQHASYGNGQTIQVMMPYSYALREVGFWFRQLWAESLGKAVDVTGATVHVGPTPIAALGPTDQHSQVQLYREGPNDKTYTFVTVKHPAADLQIPQDVPAAEGVQYLKGLSLNTILQAEQAGTEGSLQEVGRSTMHLQLDTLDAYHIGSLLFFFELATAYAGALFQVNPYDQPGVERGKIITRERLGR